MNRENLESDHWIVKVGSGVLLDGDAVDEKALQSIVDDIVWLREQGTKVTIVSSGAVALGRHVLNETKQNLSLPRLQALAATGQAKLIQMYDEAFGDTDVAQILLTRNDLNDRRRYINARMTLTELHRANVVPIVNENDTVATEELRFGDNDELAAMTAHIVESGVLVILSVAPGLCEVNEDGTLGDVLPHLASDDETLDTLALDERSGTGKGGMKTKLSAVRLAATIGSATVIAPGKVPSVLRKIREGEVIGSYFARPNSSIAGQSWAQRHRKKWIAFNESIEGTLVCDAGAKKAVVEGGASLLPSGVLSVDGNFVEGALIAMVDQGGTRFAKGLAVYSSADIEKIAGKQSSEISEILGFHVLNNVVHRDGLVLD